LAAVSVVACTVDDEPASGGTPDAANDTAVPEASHDAAGASDNRAPDGASSDVSTDEAALPDGNVADAGTDTQVGDSAPDTKRDATAVEGEAGEAAAEGGDIFSGSLLVATTDFATSTEVATIDVGAKSVVGSGSYQDGDAVPKTSNGRRFVFERTNDRVKLLDSGGLTVKTFDLKAEGGPSQNPHDVVVVPGTSTAFVSLYNSGRIAVLDLNAGTVTSTIDLTSFTAEDDPDGNPDVDLGMYVPATGLVYFTLQRIDTTGFPIACPTAPSLLVAIDPVTKAVVRPNDAGTAVDAGGGEAIALTLVSPGDIAWDASSGKLLVLANGCSNTVDGGTVVVHHGIEAINLATGASQLLYAPTSQDYLSQLVLLGPGSALVQSFAGFTGQWNRWDLTSPTLGAAIAGVPSGAVAESLDTLLGIRKALAADGGPAGYDVVRYHVSTGGTSLVVQNPLAAPYIGVGGLAFIP
jgi:hypothetical protein